MVTQAANVILYYRIPYVDDPVGRSRLGWVSLRQLDGTTFVHDHPETFRVPIDMVAGFWILDESVAPYYIASDIYVNGTKIRFDTFDNGSQTGRFKIDKDGNVYLGTR